MRRAVLLLAGMFFVTPVGVGAESVETFTGEYRWNHRDNRGPLEAVFTETGEEQWNVDFHFTFQGGDHVYTGTAEGSLSGGRLQGEVRNEDRNRTFTFQGRFDGDVFRGTHAESTAGREKDTGSLTLKR